MAPWIVGLLAIAMAGTASAQGYIDAGKTPAQLFADTCSGCHRRPQEVRRASASFLRQHYTPGSQAAAAMANYLASIPPDPRRQDRGRASPERERDRPQQAQERAHGSQERPRAQQHAPKGKRAVEVSKSAAPEPAAETAPPEPARADAPPVPKLQPFEE